MSKDPQVIYRNPEYFSNLNKEIGAAFWFWKHKSFDAANAIIDECFPNYLHFYGWYLTETNPEYSLLNNEAFCNFVSDFWLTQTIVGWKN